MRRPLARSPSFSTDFFSRRSHDQNAVLLSEYHSKAVQPKHHWPLLETRNTKAHEIFARIAEPRGQEEFHEKVRAERLAGSCEWFLDREEFRSWSQRPSQASDEAILWCQGRPGIGKTMLA